MEEGGEGGEQGVGEEVAAVAGGSGLAEGGAEGRGGGQAQHGGNKRVRGSVRGKGGGGGIEGAAVGGEVFVGEFAGRQDLRHAGGHQLYVGVAEEALVAVGEDAEVGGGGEFAEGRSFAAPADEVHHVAAYGVAAQTQVIKQADVIALLYMLGQYPAGIIAANYDYYEPRTEHGSSLSACMYALCACAIGRPAAAYPLFLKSAEADIVGGGKQWAGLVYIGGTHPAAAGGAYMVLLYGFLGLRFEDGKPTLHPRLPEGWKKVQMQVHWQGKDWLLTAEEGQQT